LRESLDLSKHKAHNASCHDFNIGWAGFIAALVCLVPLLRHFQPDLKSVALVSGAVAIFTAVWAPVDEGRLDY
jgi:hypothetical protein